MLVMMIVTNSTGVVALLTDVSSSTDAVARLADDANSMDAVAPLAAVFASDACQYRQIASLSSPVL